MRDGQLGKQTSQDDAAGRVGARAFHVDPVTVGFRFADAGAAAPLIARRPDVIFHLAAIVSGEAEVEFDKGYRINLTHPHLIDTIRSVGGATSRGWCSRPRSRYSAPFPERSATNSSTPLTSYGTQKSICELLINDYTRKGLLDGISIRLPTICVRPPNKAASGFFSNIMREPLAGEEAVLPVSDDVRHWHASPRLGGRPVHAGTMTSMMGARAISACPGLWRPSANRSRPRSRRG